MRGDTGDGDLGPDEPAVGDADLPFGGFGDDGGVDAGRVEVGEHFLNAEAGVLFVGYGGHDDLAVDSGMGRVAAGDERSGEARLHVVGAAGVEPVALHAGHQRLLGASQSDRVHVAAEQQPPALRVAAAVEDDAGSSGSTFQDV